MPDEGATTGTSRHARVHARASASAADSCDPAMDETESSASARLAPSPVLLLSKTSTQGVTAAMRDLRKSTPRHLHACYSSAATADGRQSALLLSSKRSTARLRSCSSSISQAAMFELLTLAAVGQVAVRRRVPPMSRIPGEGGPINRERIDGPRSIMMPVDAIVDPERGRAGYAKGAWSEAFESLSSADRGAPLDAGDLECLARAAHMVGRDDGYVRRTGARPPCAPRRAMRWRPLPGARSGSAITRSSGASAGEGVDGSCARGACSQPSSRASRFSRRRFIACEATLPCGAAAAASGPSQ
jgi:hypothetical protein